MARRYGGEGPRSGFSRRTFLKLGPTALCLAELPGCMCSSDDSGPTILGGAPPPDFRTLLLRKEDLVHLRFDFFNVVLNSTKTALVRKGSGARLMVVTHPPQHIVEEALTENQSLVILAPPFASRIAGLSRVAFQIPDEIGEIPYTPEELLAACALFPLAVSENALPPGTSVNVVSPTIDSNLGVNLGGNGAANGAIESSRLSRGADTLGKSSDATTSPVELDPGIKDVVTRLTPLLPTEPTALETAIELPFRLFLSPNHHGQWAHAANPVASPGGRIELWHSRLGVRNAQGLVDESGDGASQRTLRALWARESKFKRDDPCAFQVPDDLPFLTAMSSSDRIRIVHQSSNFSPIECQSRGKSNVAPAAIAAERMMLTALGGYLNAAGDWGAQPLYGLESWKHRAAMGRDHYVELVYSGVLYPFGHRASLVKVTERKFNAAAKAPHTAILWQRQYIIVREPLKSYDAGLRQFPFLYLHLKTLKTPDLSGNPSDSAPFVPEVDLRLFRFAAEALDREGNLVELELGVVWVPTYDGKVDEAQKNHLTSARGKYTGEVAKAELRGQRVAFAKASRPDDTTFEVKQIDFADSGNAGPSPPVDLKFLPAMAQAALNIEAIRHLSGQDLPAAFKYAEAYLSNEFGQGNEGQLLMELVGSPPALSFSNNSQKSGGFVAPNLDIKGLSRLTGPLSGDLKNAAQNLFDPASFLKSANALNDAKIFGVFGLKDIISLVAHDGGGLLKAPKFITQALNQVEQFLQDLSDIEAIAKRFTDQLGMNAEAAIKDVADKAAAIVTDVAAIRLDLEHIDGDIDKVTGTDVPAFTTALNNAANLFAKDPIPDQLKQLGEGERKEFKRRLDQMNKVVAEAAAGLHDAIKAFRTGAEMIKNLTVRLDWRPPVQGFPKGAEIFAPKKTNALLLAAEVRAKDSKGKKAGVDLVCSLEDFEVRLIAPATFLVLSFKKLSFTMTSGKKPEIDVVFDKLLFDGVLSFVQELKKLIPLAGFSDPPNVTVNTEGIKAGFTLALPGVTVGVFSLTNLSFSAGFHIPFIGNPLSVRFAFSTREHPFHLTVSLLGGGGFFAIEVSPAKVIVLEAALEFGAELALDLGVVSGAVSVMAGIYFRMELDDAQLTGYLRIRGNVDALGLIKVSIELYMELRYEFSSNKLVGKAKLEIQVTIAFFSIGVNITIERKFAGSANDPTFEDVMKPELGYDPFAEYLAAFDFAA